MTETTTAHPTKFGTFASCDRETYRKLKKINHFLHQEAQPWAGRWERAQKRLPKNRIFRIRRAVPHPSGLKSDLLTCKDSWLFPLFWTPSTRSVKVWSNAEGL
jgi:hypothetical protein